MFKYIEKKKTKAKTKNSKTTYISKTKRKIKIDDKKVIGLGLIVVAIMKGFFM